MSEAIATEEQVKKFSFADAQKEALAELGAEAGDVAGKGFNFLPYIKLAGGSSDEAKTGFAPVGTYVLVSGKDETQKKVLGKNLIAIPYVWRPKAMDMTVKPPLSYHKPMSEEFKAVRAAADLGGQNNKNVYGPELLMWNPEIGFFQYYLSSKTGRNDFNKFAIFFPKADGRTTPVNMGSRLIDDGKNKWHGATVEKSAISIGEPDQDTLEQQVSIFLKPIDSKKKEQPVAASSDAVLENR